MPLVALLAGSFGAWAAPYTADLESLEAHTAAPEWFRDAKFGIYFHWGVYCVPAFGSEWYPRNMHITERPEYKHHAETYGEPSAFGYHDFVPMFKAESFDPEAWADLFVKAGARFAGPVAEHHDGFSMWASKLTPWNARERGPERDIVGELEKAIRARGLRFVTSFHHAHNGRRQAEKNGKLEWVNYYPYVEGWPTASEDPELRLLYGNLPREEFVTLWEGKLREVIDAYQPDLMWFDFGFDSIPKETQYAYLAYYFNQAQKWGREVVVTTKQDLPLDIAVDDFEKGRAGHITEEPFLTDDTISSGSWCYTENLKIKPSSEVLHAFLDIVSNNGQLLLNISPMADGTIPENQRQVLLDMGAWLGRFGDAVYGTRPFVSSGEGPTKLEKGGHFVKRIEYGARDIRYTRKGDTVYAIVLGWPKARRPIVMEAFGTEGAAKDIEVKNVAFLGVDAPAEWKREDRGLIVACPEECIDPIAFPIVIETAGLPPAK